MHDKAPAHKTLILKDFLENEAIDSLPWPAISLNPIKHVQTHLEYQLTRWECRNSYYLCETLKEKWNELTPEFILGLTTSIQKNNTGRI